MEKPIKKGKPIKENPMKITEDIVVSEEPSVGKPVPFEVWFKIRKHKRHWAAPMKTFARANGLENATIEDFDKLFKQY